MRPALLAGLAILALPGIGSSQTQNGSFLATVSDVEVKMRSGPGDKFPETGNLARGTRIVVDHEELGGWLAIVPPQGSVSWVQTQFIDPLDPTRPLPQLVSVAADGDISLAAGKAGLAQPLDIRTVKVPNGTILTVIGAKVSYTGKTWYPIQPLQAGDFRYIPKTAVQAAGAVNTSFVVRGNDTVTPAAAAGAASPPPAANGNIPASIPPPAAPKPVVNNPLWAQAEAAEKDGRFDDAERLYFQLARTMNEPGGDHDIANLCYTRIHSLREKKRTATGGAAVGNDPTGRSPLLPPVNSSGNASRNNSRSGPRTTTDSDRPAPVSKTTDTRDDSPVWSAGTLTRSVLTPNGRKCYALESTPGIVAYYVIPAKNLDLEPYLDKRIQVYGSIYTRRDMSKPYIVATKSQAAP